MSDERDDLRDLTQGIPTSIYVLPTEDDCPPRAIIQHARGIEPVPGFAIVEMCTHEVEWSNDSGTWMAGPMPVPQDLADAITEHARNLGVEKFL